MSKKLENLEQFIELWTNIYNHEGKPDWSQMLPYYDDNVYFRDSVQEIKGIEEFKAMTERLAQRSKDLTMLVHNAVWEGNIIFFEWEMKISFKKYPNSSIFGASRMKLNENGLIINQRDYYDLWGDIFDNIPWLARRYRKFMRKKFG